MCDTFIALPDATHNGDLIFGKNSDRPTGEIQSVVTFPERDYPPRERLRCTYIQIPQVKHTFAVILSKPDWMWGAEMGANEHGVVIGNEAVWTNQACNRSGLLGMDLVRLGLERSATSFAALEVIVGLLSEFGQGGNCAEHFELNYHNSFLIADRRRAWVLETAGNFWVAEEISSGTRSISNNLSIHGRGDLSHPDLDFIIAGVDSENSFSGYFSAGGLADELSPYSREDRVRSLCRDNLGRFDIDTARSILSDHEAGVCMHGEFETRGSQISVLSDKCCTHYFIDRPFPCTQDYREVSFKKRGATERSSVDALV